MFERNKVDNGPGGSAGGATAVPVEITLSSGDVVEGKVILPAGRSIWEHLNGPASFIEVEPYGSERSFIAKAALRGIKLVAVPGASQLQARQRELDGFDPHGVLGITRAATFDEVRAAYHRQAKAYHPDRYASADLPSEVRDYLSAVARRINIAFATLEKAHQAARMRPTHQVSTPIYTTQGRGP